MDLERISNQLIERRKDLVAELARLTAPPEQGTNVGFGKRVGDGTTEAVERISTTATARSLNTSIEEIDKALVRIDSGGYGTCEVCGQPVGEARLQARPASLRCVGCASS